MGDEYLQQELDEVWQGAEGPSVRGPQEDGIHNAEQPRVLDSIRDAGYDDSIIKAQEVQPERLNQLRLEGEASDDSGRDSGVEGFGGERRGRDSNQGGRGTVRRTIPEIHEGNAIYGRSEQLIRPAAFGEVPVQPWVRDSIIDPAEGTDARAEQQMAMEYGVPSFVVSDIEWDRNRQGAPAFSAGGQIFLRETLPEEGRGTYVPHEVTHVMKQVGYQPYLDFIQRTPDMLKMSSRVAQRLIEGVGEHRGIDPFHMTSKERVDLYDELNATIYGSIAAGEEGALKLVRPAFEDFDAYTAELLEIHRQFKEQRNRSYPEELGAARPGEESLDERGGKFIRGSEPYDEFVGNIQRMLHAGAGTTAQAVRRDESRSQRKQRCPARIGGRLA